MRQTISTTIKDVWKPDTTIDVILTIKADLITHLLFYIIKRIYFHAISFARLLACTFSSLYAFRSYVSISVGRGLSRRDAEMLSLPKTNDWRVYRTCQYSLNF